MLSDKASDSSIYGSIVLNINLTVATVDLTGVVTREAANTVINVIIAPFSLSLKSFSNTLKFFLL